MSEPDQDEGTSPWPPAVDALIASAAAADDSAPEARAIGVGMGLAAEAERWLVGATTVYRFESPSSAGLQRLARLLHRLSQAAPFEVSPVVGQLDRWLVTVSPSGHPADKPELHADPDDLVVALGRGLRALHDLPTAVLDEPPLAAVLDEPPLAAVLDEPPLAAVLDEPPLAAVSDHSSGGWAAIAELCRQAVDGGAVVPERLPRPYNRYQPAELLKLWLDGRPTMDVDGSEAASPVLCHGFAAAERFIVHGGKFAGFDRMEAPIVADRHFDLAVAHQSVQHHFGPEAIFRLYDAYGGDPNVVLLDHYVLASHLLGLAPLVDTSPAGGHD